MKNQTAIHISNYAAPYKGNFISSLEKLEERLENSGNNKMIYIFPDQCKNTNWIEKFVNTHKVYFVSSPGKKYKEIFGGGQKKLIQDLKKIFEEEKPSIIHCHFDGYDECVVKANKVNAEIIWHEHNERSLVKNPIKKIYQKINLRYQYGVIGKKVHIISLYNGFEKFLRRYGYKGNIEVIPNGIEEKRITFSPKVRGDSIKFLTFGGRADDKGLDILLKSIKILKKRTNCKFVIYITKGKDTKEWVNKNFEDDIPKEIDIIPQTENVSGLFEKVDCFLAPSRRETFSYAVAEAMLSGTPAIISDLEAVSWAFSQKSIITFESENVNDLAEKIINYMENNVSEQYLKDARKFVLENYTVSAWADKVIKYYDSILS